jgi:predicted ATP-dependent protease
MLPYDQSISRAIPWPWLPRSETHYSPAKNILRIYPLGDNPTKITPVITALLIVSVCVNVFFLVFYVPSDQSRLSQLNGRLTSLSTENTQLQAAAGEAAAAEGNTGNATLQAPAVSQSIQDVVRGRYIVQAIVQKGAIMNISVEIQPGKGRVLVQTKPLMGLTFQDAANTAVGVAGNKTGYDLSKSDVIYSIEAGDQVPAVDGPSAGGLMTLLAISALEKRPINGALTMTGTIQSDGHIGAIGGVVEKATAAKENGKTLFLIPADNQLITPPSSGNAAQGFFTPARSVQQVSARDYIEKNVGINVTYVRTIDDVLAAAL